LRGCRSGSAYTITHAVGIVPPGRVSVGARLGQPVPVSTCSLPQLGEKLPLYQADSTGSRGGKSTGKFVVFFGLDEPPDKVPKFVRGIPIEKVMDPDTLLALQMNGAPLPKHHDLANCGLAGAGLRRGVSSWCR
jgi:hypothetical protein